MNGYHAPVKFKRARRRVRRNRRKLKPNTAILFIVIFVIVCIASTVALGNYLRGKIDPNAEHDDVSAEETDSGTTAPVAGVSELEAERDNVRSGCIDVCGNKDLTKIETSAELIFASGYDSVTIPLTNISDGSLTYLSPAALTLTRITEDSGLPKFEDIITSVKRAADKYSVTPKITAYIRLSTGKTEDPILAEAALSFETALIAEAYSLGADEVLISGFHAENGVLSDPDSIFSLLEKLQSMTPGIVAGIALPASVYANNAMSLTLERLSTTAGFLAVDTSSLDWSYEEQTETVYDTDENGGKIERTETVRVSGIYDSLYNAASSIKGSVSLYGLSFTFEGENFFVCREAADALTACGIYSFYITNCAVKAPDTGSDTNDDGTGGNTDTRPDSTKPKDNGGSAESTKPPSETTKKESDKPDTEPDNGESDTTADTTIDMESYWEWYV